MRNGPWQEFIICNHIFLPKNAIFKVVTLPGFMLSNLSKSNPVVLLSPISSSHQTCKKKKTIVINVLTTYLNNNLMV